MRKTLLISTNQAIIGLESNKARTSLTTLGIIIGIAVVIIVISAGNGAELWIKEQMDVFGGNNIIFAEIQVPSSRTHAESGLVRGSGIEITTMKQKDADDTERIPGVVATYALGMGQEKITYGNKEKKIGLFGTNSSYPSIDKQQIAEGHFFSDEEEAAIASVVVLGSTLKKILLGDEDALGKFVRIKGQDFRVIGVMKSVGARFTLNYDEYAFLPLKTLQKKIVGIDSIMYFVAKVQDESKVEFVTDQMRTILRRNHNIRDNKGDKDDFIVMGMKEASGIIDTVLGGVTLLIGVIAGISLLVGGIGIMNVMFVAVTERTKEIGLRKALGARASHILLQFLLESIFITVLGGAIGVAVGVLISSLIASVAQSLQFNWPLIITWDSIILAIATSSAFGLVFGIVPARQAAALDPVEALRFEY